MERNIGAPCTRRAWPSARYATKCATVALPAHSQEHELATGAAYETRPQTTPTWPSARCAGEITSQVTNVAQNDT
ncbi:hypothetical protein HPB48_016686 [Haemaphysalis longicornis]|uniref:Uncharacterized protein n=1 Tax=Haemaphysalis longicornis TaxID=44386 RepID=A0A9J6FAH0_HAELO|nr:hypothetical protein HPB48_016686 [Haemaphysalis longicornis]